MGKGEAILVSGKGGKRGSILRFVERIFRTTPRKKSSKRCCPGNYFFVTEGASLMVPMPAVIAQQDFIRTLQGGGFKEFWNFHTYLKEYWDVLLVLRINRLFHPYISRLDTSQLVGETTQLTNFGSLRSVPA